MAQVHVPRVSEITGRLAPAEVAAEREWLETARRRRELAAALETQRQAKAGIRHPHRRQRSCGLSLRCAFQRLARETRSV